MGRSIASGYNLPEQRKDSDPVVNPKTRMPRDIAIRTYARWLKAHQRIDVLTTDVLKREGWSSRDRALFMELMYGVIRWHGRLQWIIKRLSRREVTADHIALAAAAVGVYQLLMLDRVPDYAVVDSSVEVARRAGGPKSGGWVNAILRKCASKPDYWRDTVPESGDKTDLLAIEFSHPTWMIARWSRRMPVGRLREFLEWNNRRPELYLRVSRGAGEVATVTNILSMRKIEAKVSEVDSYSLRISHSGNPADLKVVREGRVTVQDVSQSLVSYLVDPQPGERILDMCAAPGGKTSHLAELCPDCKIVATDASDQRLEILKRMIQRRNLPQVKVVPYQDVLTSSDQYDAILVDAPCTGTGVLARRPDLRWRRKPDDVKRLSAVQLQLLNYAANRVKLGGRIVYSTCSVEPEENGDTVQAFLKNVKGFRLSNGREFLPDAVVNRDGCLSLLGPEIKSDGVFAVRLERG